VIISAYTGYLCVEFSKMHAAVEKKLGRPIWTHEFPIIMDSEIRPAFKDDFVAMAPNDRPHTRREFGRTNLRHKIWSYTTGRRRVQ
jgi:hypothetical protein